jgi:hypothetical protein
VYRDKPAGRSVAGARAQLAGLRKFIVDHDVVTIPGPEVAEVDEAPPVQSTKFRLHSNSGAVRENLPVGLLHRAARSELAESRAVEFMPGKQMLLFTSAHEVWPGHFLQFLHANRAESQIGKYSSATRTPKVGRTTPKS